MGIVRVDILLDNDNATYKSGQSLSGKVEYTLDSPKQIRGICVKFKGLATTSFLKNQELPIDKPLRHFGREEYFNTRYYVIGSKNGEAIEIPTGKYVYPFSYQLPLNLPPSFEGILGFIFYTIKVKVERPWKLDQDTELTFTVISDLDLNSNLEYRKPVHLQIEKSLRYCCYYSGNVSVDVRIPVGGFCPGQSIPFNVTCENNTYSTLKDIKIRLRKIMTFRSEIPKARTKVLRKGVADLSLGKVKSGQSQNWKTYFEVPPLPPSKLLNCSIIDVDYEIKIICYPKDCHRNICQCATIYVGTVPLIGFQPGAAQSLETLDYDDNPMLQNNGQPMPGSSHPASNFSTAPSAPQMETYYPMYSNRNGESSPPPLYESLVPPSYMEAQFTATSIRDSEGNPNMKRPDFTPPYPTYGFGISPK